LRGATDSEPCDALSSDAGFARATFSYQGRRKGGAASAVVAACLVAAAIFATAHPAAAQSASAVEACLAGQQPFASGAELPRSLAALQAGAALKIVAIGSSSTLGLWQGDPAKTYPGMLQDELRRLKPGVSLTVINSGRNADTIPGNIARFERDVLAHAPDLVIWQVGTNDVTWLQSGDSLTQKIVDGVRMLRASGADVILMDQQYAPVILASQYAKMQASIADAARQARVPLFSRFDLMRRAVDGGLSITALTAWDGLHQSAAGYECVGRALARAIMAATDGVARAPPKRPSKRAK
jgi:acyl-CoA thioesterase-1